MKQPIKKSIEAVSGMEEVISLEGEIRKALAAKKVPPGLVDDARAIMAGKPTIITGTRLERLRAIASGLNAK